MSEYEISPEISGRVNASNYEIADILAIANGETVKEQVVINENEEKNKS